MLQQLLFILYNYKHGKMFQQFLITASVSRSYFFQFLITAPISRLYFHRKWHTSMHETAFLFCKLETSVMQKATPQLSHPYNVFFWHRAHSSCLFCVLKCLLSAIIRDPEISSQNWAAIFIFLSWLCLQAHIYVGFFFLSLYHITHLLPLLFT